MTKLLQILALTMLLAFGLASNTEAQRGCCSHHHGVAECNETTGYWRCNDGTDSPSCRCKDGQDVGSATVKKRRRK